MMMVIVQQNQLTGNESSTTTGVASVRMKGNNDDATNHEDYMLDAINEEDSQIENSLVEEGQPNKLEIEIDEVMCAPYHHIKMFQCRAGGGYLKLELQIIYVCVKRTSSVQ
jgi:hypothetical protein